jgi:hypothetical protein
VFAGRSNLEGRCTLLELGFGMRGKSLGFRNARFGVKVQAFETRVSGWGLSATLQRVWRGSAGRFGIVRNTAEQKCGAVPRWPRV